jgi:flagellar protein FlaG
MDVKPVANLQTSLEANLQSLDSKVQRVQEVELQKSQREREKLSPELLEEALKNLKEKLSMLNTQLKIEIDKETDIVVVKVIDKQSKEVIRQIPPEYVLKIAKYLDEIAGLLFSEKA